MWFDVKAELGKMENGTAATIATSATREDNVAIVANIAGIPTTKNESLAPPRKVALAKIEAGPPANLANSANRSVGLARLARLAAPPDVKIDPDGPCQIRQAEHALCVAEAFNSYGRMVPNDPEAWK